ncbi:sensor histidine kinase [Paenibacillus qinlingensis]|uniref:Sensor histidine kinase YesM n=1 Tax=Paenibacillus qinlingensis TaxID=1837343 RepID=A0ABU1P2H4_9BACL|nr:sensor histidine kinase [Paenibacillus qinlingensis]MDR6553940.1 sensor histidine kinase YesM [Paenibacillus qinlingensis]
MNRISAMFRKLRITPKVFLLTFLCFELLTLVTAYSFNQHSSEILIKSQMDYARQAVQKSNRYLDSNLQNIRTALSSIVNDSRLKTGDYKQLETWMSVNLLYLSPNLSNVHLISNQDVLASSSSHSWDLFDDPVIQQLLASPLVDSKWVGPYHSTVSGYTLTYVTPVDLMNGSRGILLADVNLERLYYTLFPDEVQDVSENLIILDKELRPVIGKEPYIHYDYVQKIYHLTGFDPFILRSSWGQKEFMNPQADDSLIMTRGYNTILKWQLVVIMNKSELLAPLKQSISDSIQLALISFLLALGLSLFVTVIISSPIKRMTKYVQKVGEGDLDSQLAIKTEDEIGYLAMHFNVMTKKIGQLLSDLKYSEEQKKLSDFRALHAQIKPHFLYNTLNTISMLGRRGDMEKMDTLISALSNQLHYALDNSPDPVKMREELIAIENYVELMKIRYPNKCEFEFDIDPLSLEYKLPKFILQPIVENAIFHGIVPKDAGGTVYIGTMVNQGDWEILIEDNGVGMEKETLQELVDKLEQREKVVNRVKHIGIVNVHERFQLMFGSEYQLTIDSHPQIGTKIWIKLPKERAGSVETSSFN